MNLLQYVILIFLAVHFSKINKILPFVCGSSRSLYIADSIIPAFSGQQQDKQQIAKGEAVRAWLSGLSVTTWFAVIIPVQCIGITISRSCAFSA